MSVAARRTNIHLERTYGMVCRARLRVFGQSDSHLDTAPGAACNRWGTAHSNTLLLAPPDPV
eukprot:scaffold240_cov129-Isochrysis_galbana.AAC.1